VANFLILSPAGRVCQGSCQISWGSMNDVTINLDRTCRSLLCTTPTPLLGKVGVFLRQVLYNEAHQLSYMQSPAMCTNMITISNPDERFTQGVRLNAASSLIEDLAGAQDKHDSQGEATAASPPPDTASKQAKSDYLLRSCSPLLVTPPPPSPSPLRSGWH
jgi:hypothetical protein